MVATTLVDLLFSDFALQLSLSLFFVAMPSLQDLVILMAQQPQ